MKLSTLSCSAPLKIIEAFLFVGIILVTLSSTVFGAPVLRVNLPYTFQISDDAEKVQIRKIKMSKQVVAEREVPNTSPCWGDDTPRCPETEVISTYAKVPTIEVVYDSEEDSFLNGEMVPNPNNPDELIPSKTIRRQVFLKGEMLPQNLQIITENISYQKRVIDEKRSEFCPRRDDIPYEDCEDKIVYKIITANGVRATLSERL